MSKRLAIPNRPAKLGSSKLASGIPTGERAGRVNTPQPYMPAKRKNEVAVMNPANRESRPSFPRLNFCNHSGQSNRVVSVAKSSKEMVRRMNGKKERKLSYHPNSGPNAMRATMMRGSERNNPSCDPRADHATPRAALPDNNMRCPGSNDRAVSPSGAPMRAEGM